MSVTTDPGGGNAANIPAPTDNPFGIGDSSGVTWTGPFWDENAQQYYMLGSNGSRNYNPRPPSGGSGGGSTSPTNVFINNNPGDLNQDIVSDGSDGFPAGTVYQRNQLTGAITVKYRPPAPSAAPASLYNDLNNDGYDDQTGLPNGVARIPGTENADTGFYGLWYHGQPVNPDGSPFQGSATASVEAPKVTTVSGVPYVWDGTKFVVAPGITPPASQGGTVGSSGVANALNGANANSAALINAQAAAARAQSQMASDAAARAFQAQQAQASRDFQTQQAALDRAMQQARYDELTREFNANYGLQQQSQQADIATQYANAAGSADPLYFESWLAGGVPLSGVNESNLQPIFERLQPGGTNAISPRSLEAAGSLYGLLGQGGQTSLPTTTGPTSTSTSTPPASTTTNTRTTAGGLATSTGHSLATRNTTPREYQTIPSTQTPEQMAAAAAAAQQKALAAAKQAGSYGNFLTQREMGLNLATQGSGITPDQYQGIYGMMSTPTRYGTGSDGMVSGNGDLDAYIGDELGPELHLIDWKNGTYSVTPLKDRYAGVSIANDKKGVYAYTHRARSKSYPSKEKIPNSVLRFIESTG